MPSKQVTDRQKSADSVIAAADTHGPAVSAALTDRLTPYLQQGEAVPDVALLLSLIGRALCGEKDRLVSADEAHERELGDDAEVRAARDEAFETLYSEMVNLREVLTGLYGGTYAASLFQGITPRDPVVLVRFAELVEKNLQSATLPKARIKGASLDKDEEIGKLAGLRKALDGHLKAVNREVREAQVTQAAKNETMDEYDDLFGAAATVLSGFLRLSGKDELAANLKPARKRPGQTAADAGEVAETQVPLAPPVTTV